MISNNISTSMFIVAFFLFVVGILTVFDAIGNALSTILFIVLFVISIIIKILESLKKNKKDN
ncbi:hypothetical protein [Halalkalibacter flavus]|uniref:hypothetical protein n=1 Tax=Halalkalibacter flavus TaxID=3090668 RepID=UPI002FCBE8AF